MIKLAIVNLISSKLWPYLLIVLATFFAPIKTVMTAVIVLMLIDFICGIIAAKKRGDKITSNKMKDSVIKLFLYQLAIFCAHLITVYFIKGIPFVNIVAGLIGCTEMLSIFENISNVTGINFIKHIKDAIITNLNRKNDRN